MRNFGKLVLVAALALLSAVAHAQQNSTQVTRAQSLLLLDLPGLENSRETYNYLGWTQNYAVETSYAAATVASGPYPRAQVYLRQLSKGRHWTHSEINEAWIRSIGPFFKDRALTIERGTGQRTDHVVTLPFRSDNAPCVGFILRHITHDRYGSATGSGNASIEGIYCGQAGTTISAEQERSILAGVYRRIGDQIVRAREGDASPIPASLRR